MNVIGAIVRKQWMDTLKNKEVLIQFIMFPILTIFMNSVVKVEGMPQNFFVCLFATMYVGMAPLTSMAAIISEEKEKNTLRVLMMSGVKPLQYLVGVGGYIWGICMVGAVVFLAVGKYTGIEAAYFLGSMAAGILCSLTIGAAIGTGSKNQMAATSITVPVMMVFSFLPMLAMFNDIIKNVARWTYSEQLHQVMSGLDACKITAENVIVVLVNMVLALLLFCYAYRRSGFA